MDAVLVVLDLVAFGEGEDSATFSFSGDDMYGTIKGLEASKDVVDDDFRPGLHVLWEREEGEIDFFENSGQEL
jgi:hypothetical protein